MKILRILLPAILLIALIGCAKDEPEPQEPPRPSVEQLGDYLKTLPGVESVEELQTSTYKKYYLIVFKQLLDPKNPAAGTFPQRVFLAHQDFDRPVTFETEGYNSQWALTQAKHTELNRRYQANSIMVEHRYSGLSLPAKYEWKYLTCENAAADLHTVREVLGAAYTGSWIATGASKGGTNSMNYIMRYPNDMAAAVAYVGPICNSREDQRFVNHILTVATPEMRKKIVDFQRELLIRRNRIQPIFYTEPAKPTGAKEYMTNDQSYESGVVDFVYGVWQYGWPIDEIPTADATDKKIIDYLTKKDVFASAPSSTIGVDDREPVSIVGYLRSLKKHSTRADGEPDLSMTHYYVQAMIELGNYGLTIKPVEDLMPNHESWSKNMLARFIVPADAADIQFSDKLCRQMNQWLQNDDPRLICVYGEYDPWVAASPDKAYFAGKSNMAIFFKKGGSHRSRIEDLAPADEQQVWAKLDSWVK